MKDLLAFPKKLLRVYHRKSVTEQAVSDIKRNNFWFVDVPRTSSTSIKSELGDRFGVVHGKKDVYERATGVPHPFPDHRTAQFMRDSLGEASWNKLFSFTIVRNPWDRVVSLYYHRLKRKTVSADLSFEDYVQQYKSPRYNLQDAVHSWPQFYYSACEFLQNEKGEMLVDYVAKYENREEDLKYIAEKIQLPGLGVTSVNQSKPEKDYRSFYNEHTMQIIKDAYASDVELFGYDFDRGLI